MNNYNFLEETGLTNNEALVYQILLESGKLGVRDLIKICKLKRGNLYNILYSLSKKQLVEEFEYRNVKHFRALSPENIRKLVVEKRNRLRHVTIKIDEVLPQLMKTFQTSSEKPGVYYYDGIEGIKHVYDRILSEKKDLMVFVSNFERHDPEINKILNHQIKKQYKIGIRVQGLSGHEYTKEHLNTLHRYNSFPRIIDNMLLDSEILIFGDCVAITTFKKDYFTTLMINKQIAQTLKCIFQIMYKSAREPNAMNSKSIKIKINHIN
jgi:sugar-specific transcriptional regulator TrmB